MCNQTVCLVAAELERQGITTVAIQLLRTVAEKVKPPRALFVPFDHGYPLERPAEPEPQCRVIDAALRLVEDPGLRPPVLVEFDPAERSVDSPCGDRLRPAPVG